MKTFSEIWKDAPCEGDVHVMSAGGKKATKKGDKFSDMSDDLDIQKSAAFRGAVIKMDDEKQHVLGWASIVTKDGQPVQDHQGDVISVDEITKAAHKFMNSYRVGKAQHAGDQVGDVVESMVFDKALQKALGIDLGMEGWLIKYHVKDPAVWAQVKKGGLKAFSIGGKGERTKM